MTRKGHAACLFLIACHRSGRFLLTHARHSRTIAPMTHARQKTPEITLGWRLRIAMEHAGLKADDMARELGVHRGTITRWTHDVGASPRGIYLRQWAELTKVPFGWLMGDNGQGSSRVNHRYVREPVAA